MWVQGQEGLKIDKEIKEAQVHEGLNKTVGTDASKKPRKGVFSIFGIT